MSGGSFEYLFAQEQPKPHLVEAMAAELERRGYLAAAAETRTYLPKEVPGPLADLWKAVEWCVSNDTGPEQVGLAHAAWRRNTRRT